mmetsp:Transcript_40495/g.101902  ORF Transcript_40495/g.101902 Transcript_40495/m.101902 type:complete len:252 (+) Transcript_40495:1520-2275(+)
MPVFNVLSERYEPLTAHPYHAVGDVPSCDLYTNIEQFCETTFDAQRSASGAVRPFLEGWSVVRRVPWKIYKDDYATAKSLLNLHIHAVEQFLQVARAYVMKQVDDQLTQALETGSNPPMRLLRDYLQMRGVCPSGNKADLQFSKSLRWRKPVNFDSSTFFSLTVLISSPDSGLQRFVNDHLGLSGKREHSRESTQEDGVPTVDSGQPNRTREQEITRTFLGRKIEEFRLSGGSPPHSCLYPFSSELGQLPR